MHLIRDDIIDQAALVGALFCHSYQCGLEELYDEGRWLRELDYRGLVAYASALDFVSAGAMARGAQTFLFDHDQILAFLRAIDRKLPPGDYPAPFEQMIVQFSRGIDEKLFTTGERVISAADDHDQILALLITTPRADEPAVVNIAAWFASASVNRIKLDIKGDGTVFYEPIVTAQDSQKAALLQADKQRLANLALLCLAYLHSPNTQVSHIVPDKQVNQKRVAKGKRTLPDYYICHTHRAHVVIEKTSSHSSRAVSFRFDVQGHFRHLPTGKTVWVKAHQRGLAHDLYKPKIYHVD